MFFSLPLAFQSIRTGARLGVEVAILPYVSSFTNHPIDHILRGGGLYLNPYSEQMAAKKNLQDRLANHMLVVYSPKGTLTSTSTPSALSISVNEMMMMINDDEDAHDDDDDK